MLSYNFVLQVSSCLCCETNKFLTSLELDCSLLHFQEPCMQIIYFNYMHAAYFTVTTVCFLHQHYRISAFQAKSMHEHVRPPVYLSVVTRYPFVTCAFNQCSDVQFCPVNHFKLGWLTSLYIYMKTMIIA